ncbi:hypothetical protein CDAR_311761 [Caerostris darwini]|uniref:Uncharacterized protein n=1 Tax=Caerostris darwini TaxID=1538125 RepID=A0AAV4TMW5_9ARAC|nr:hypothetical protein CDAR_311761 [Caerostris darwini]
MELPMERYSNGYAKQAPFEYPPQNFLVERSSNGYAKQVPFEYPPQVQADKKKEHTTKQWSIGKEQRENKRKQWIYLFIHEKEEEKSLPEGKKVASADVTDNNGKQVQEEEKQLLLFSPQWWYSTGSNL